MKEPNLASRLPELETIAGASYSGFVDLIDVRGGVRGWAVNLNDPLDPVRILLFAGDAFVAEVFTSAEREDISAMLGRRAVAAFTFGGEVMMALTTQLDDADAEISVRVAETGQLLPGPQAPVRVGDILAQLRAETQAPARNNTADFELLLDELRAGAAALAELQLRPIPENLQGYVETMAVDSRGQVWFMGWVKRGHMQEFAAVVVERRKYPASVAVMSYGRDDLPQDSCGIVGLISSTWRPNSATSDVYIFFGANGRFYLRANQPLRLVTSSELVSEYEGVSDRCLGDGRAIPLQRMLTALENWLPTRTAKQWFATETSIDRVLLVPGLGCLVEGWVMSPMKRVEGLRLRVGAAVMASTPDSLYWKPRPDLLGAFPGSERMVERAGFVGLFAGDAEPEDFADPVFKVIFQGGSSANWGVQPAVFRRLGHSASIEDALRFFPALQEEAFFPCFAEAAIRAERVAMNPPVPLSITRGRRALVFALPDDSCDLFLLFEELAQQCRTTRGIEAITFVAASSSNRSDAMWLFREFQGSYGARCGMACSLLMIDDPSQCFALLPEILAATGASRFVFVAAGVFLTAAGWARAREALTQAGNDLVFLALCPEPFQPPDGEPGVTARCFAWSAGHFARWALAAPLFLGGFHRDNGLHLANVPHAVHPDAARSTRTRLSTRVQDAVNEAVYVGASKAGTLSQRLHAPRAHGRPDAR